MGRGGGAAIREGLEGMTGVGKNERRDRINDDL